MTRPREERRTVTRFDFLDNIEDLLWDSTAQTITESLQRGESPEHGELGETPPCAWCGHEWHGLPCAPLYYNWFAAGGHGDWAYEDCGCVNGSTPPDDTWRPQLDDVERLMRDEGLDGWAAHASRETPFCVCAPCAHRNRRRAERFRRSRWSPTVRVSDQHMNVHPRRNGRSALIDALIANGAELVVHQDVTYRPDNHHVHVALDFNGAGEAFGRLVESLQGFGYAASSVGSVMDALQHHLAADPATDDEPLNPRARALALRQQRTTGPTRPTAAQSRRPRRHGAAR